MADLFERDAVIWITAETGALETQRRVKELPAVNRWIPCSESLPEDFSWCLVCMADGFIRLGRWNAKYDDTGAWQVLLQNGEKMYRIKTVPHWMPLPEPPKE